MRNLETPVGITIGTGAPSPLKKVKLEALDPTVVASSNTSINSQTQKSGIRRNADGYITESIKPRNKYTMKDLPVPGDNRWSHGVIATMTLWCSTQPNPWTIPEEKMAPALQIIFNNVYPNVKYHVTPSGSVFAIVSDFVQSLS